MEDSSEFQGNQLPLEIVITIFEYLSIQDIKNASVTCKNWLSASMHSTVMDRRVLVLAYEGYLNSEMKITLNEPILSYNSLKMCFKTDYTTNDITEYSDGLKKKTLMNIFCFLSKFENLHSLNIDLFAYPRYTNQKCWYMNDESIKPFNSMKVLKIALNDNILFCHLPYFLDSMPLLEHIDIQFGSFGLISEEPCLSCTRKHLFDYIKKGKNRIKTLILDVDKETEKLISTIEGMNLTTMSGNAYLNLTDPNKLQHFWINKKEFKVDMDFIFMKFPNLETLSLRTCPDRTNGIKKFEKLKELIVDYDCFDELITTLSEYESNVLTHLYLRYHYESWPDIQGAGLSFQYLTNLTHISLWNFKFTDPQMQEVCMNLNNLQHFALKSCGTFLTDYGFTGEAEDIDTGFSISKLKHLKLLHIELDCSYLGTTALVHVTKMKGLEYLCITCSEKSYIENGSLIKDLRENCPGLLKRAEIRFSGWDDRLPKVRPFNKLLPLNDFIHYGFEE